MKKNLILFLIILICSCGEQVNDSVASEQQTKVKDSLADPTIFIGEHKSKVMVLGVFHFRDAGLDTYKPKYPFDILNEERQQELDTLLVKIAAYNPTKILIESNRIKMDSITNTHYQNYLKGGFKIDDKANEIFQIGFKLAKKLGHNRLYPADASADWFGVELDWDNYDDVAYLKSRNQYEKYSRYDYEPFYELHDSLKTTHSLSEHLLLINNPKDRLKDHQSYLTSILEGAGDNYLGADNVARWYRRNLRIFANAYDIADFQKEERLLLIYGSGHVWQLRQFFKDSPDFEYVEAIDYLE